MALITFTVTALPKVLYRWVSETMAVQLSGKPCSLSHSMGVSRRICICWSKKCSWLWLAVKVFASSSALGTNSFPRRGDQSLPSFIFCRRISFASSVRRSVSIIIGCPEPSSLARAGIVGATPLLISRNPSPSLWVRKVPTLIPLRPLLSVGAFSEVRTRSG